MCRVPPEEDLRRAVRPSELDDVGKPTSVPFSFPNISMDAASLATLLESRSRFPKSYWAVIECHEFNKRGHYPEYNPISENVSHVLLRDRMKKSYAREIRNAIKRDQLIALNTDLIIPTSLSLKVSKLYKN